MTFLFVSRENFDDYQRNYRQTYNINRTSGNTILITQM